MTQDEMWKAVSDNDASYDGIFFYGVKSTGIYCRPSCKSKTPKRENTYFFDTHSKQQLPDFVPVSVAEATFWIISQSKKSQKRQSVCWRILFAKAMN